jgi:hypothetical protein
MNKEQALRTIKLLSALESYAFMIEKFMPDYLHDELITIMGELESIVLDKPIETDFLTVSKYSGAEYTNPHKHNDSLLQNVELKVHQNE